MVDATRTSSDATTTFQSRRNWLHLTLRLYLTIITPVLLTLIGVRLVMLAIFLNVEYNRPDFPADFYGFTTEDRLHYAPFALHYILTDVPISYLGDLRLPGEKCYPTQRSGTECSMYNQNELRHMVDVQVVTRYAFAVGAILGIGALGSASVLMRSAGGRIQLRKGLASGAIATLSIVAAIVIAAVVAWDTFFTGFHELFFESGTWRFAYSDTLIRLFPEQFWFDAALIVGMLTVIDAVVILLLIYRWGKRAS